MMPGEVYWVDFHDSIGRGQGGTRPAVVLQDDTTFPKLSPMVVVVPLTTTFAALRFSATLKIDPSPVNGLASPSIALVFQTRAVDRTSLHGKIGQLEQSKLDDMYVMLDRLLGR